MSNELVNKQIEMLSEYKSTGNFPICTELSVFLRSAIKNGKLKSGEKLPPLRVLSDIWNVNYFTLQQVTEELMKDGLLHKYHAKGIFVAPDDRKFKCLGIYFSRVFNFYKEEMFYMLLREMICHRLHDLGINYVIWDDVRPPAKHDGPPDYLTEAIVKNQVQGIVGLQLRTYDRPWFMKLQTKLFVFEKMGYEDDMFWGQTNWRDIAEKLKLRNCKRIAVVVPEERSGKYRFLVDDLKKAGVKLMPRYQRVVAKEKILEHSLEEMGYLNTMDLLNGNPKPDAIIVFPDHAVLGAIQAILQSGILVPEKLFVVFHRNVELGYFCPFEATYLDVKIKDICDSLVKQIIK